MFTVGIDPGLTETGMVLLSPEGHYLSGITFRAPKDGPDLERIVNLADVIRATVVSWICDHHIQELLIGLEYPIMRASGNSFAVETYRKQINLLHEIEAGLWRWRTDNFSAGKIRVTEVNPTASKRTMTGSGSATKDDMVAASPFARRDEVRRPTREALADAWAHAITAKLVNGVERLIDLEDVARERLVPQFVDTKVFKVEVQK